jgi:predicted nucleic acid-binding protein
LGGSRAIFDANLYLNFLLSRDPEVSVVGLLLRSATRSEFDHLFPADVAGELTQAIARRPYLTARISWESLDAFFDRLDEFATPLPLLEQALPRLSRDANDDYLIALAVLNAVDYLVTRDRDLLDLGDISGVRIVDPVTFLRLIRASSGPG